MDGRVVSWEVPGPLKTVWSRGSQRPRRPTAGLPFHEKHTSIILKPLLFQLLPLVVITAQYSHLDLHLRGSHTLGQLLQNVLNSLQWLRPDTWTGPFRWDTPNQDGTHVSLRPHSLPFSDILPYARGQPGALRSLGTRVYGSSWGPVARPGATKCCSVVE